MQHSTSRKTYIFAGILVVLAVIIIAARLYLNGWLLDYVNRSLANLKGYEGSVEAIDIDLYRGAYRIHQLKIFKKTGQIPTPFVDIETTDLSVEWGALFHGRIVSDVDLTKPVINFAVNKAGTVEQTGSEIDWIQLIDELMPIDINKVTFREGKLTYQDFSTTPQVNVYINHMTGEAQNLRNIVDTTQALPSALYIKGDSIGNGKLEIKGRMNILKKIPDMDMDTRLENVHLPALSNYSNAYAAIDIEKGTLNVYSELSVKNNRVSGYIKPIATHISLISLTKETNPIKLAWEVVMATVVEIFSNQSKDQFATKITLEGNLDNIETDTWSAIAGIIRNAFIEAFKKGIDSDSTSNTPPD